MRSSIEWNQELVGLVGICANGRRGEVGGTIAFSQDFISFHYISAAESTAFLGFCSQ